MSKIDTSLFMSKTVICVVYVDDYLFWEYSHSDINNVMKYFKEDGPSYNWEHSKGGSVSEFLELISRHCMMVDSSFIKLD